MTVALVTGGAGYLGAALVKALAARGDRVRVLDLLDPQGAPAGVEVVRGSVADEAAVKRAMRGVEVVHHAAASVPLAKDPMEFHRTNVIGTRTVVDAATAAGVRQLVHVSTSAVYGAPARCPVTEATPAAPIEPYGRAKLEAERYVLASRIPAAVVRPRTLVGTERLGIFQILFEWISEGRRIFVLGSGRQRLQLLHVDDAVSAMLLVSDRGATGAFNIGAGRFGTLREDLTALIRHAGTRARVVPVPAAPAIAALWVLDRMRLSPLAPWHYRTYHRSFFFDISRAEQELGWRPRYGNVDALIASYDRYLATRDRPKDGRSRHRSGVRQRVLSVLKHLS